MHNKVAAIDWVLVGTVLVVVFGYILLHGLLGGSFLDHNSWDSYTLQAMAWRNGSVALGQDYSYLEIAYYDGGYFLSFPPFPSVIMLPFTFIFGENTPSNLIIMLFAIISVVFAYLIFKRMAVSAWSAMFWALFTVFGSNILWMSTMGGVWLLAQTLNFMLCIIAVYCCVAGCRTLPLSLLAAAIGCRPFTIFLAVAMFTFFVLDDYRGKRYGGIAGAILVNLKHLIIPTLICSAYLVYNYVRFDDPFEFGHNYLPEFSEAGSEQFGAKYFLENIKNIFIAPVLLDSGPSNTPYSTVSCFI